jgi:Carboxypeptidase regulatory-like domain
MLKRQRTLAVLFLGFVLAAASAAAQSLNSGDITGTIADASGAVLAKTPVELQNNTTGVKQSTMTNGQGSYRFAFLVPGIYTLSVKAGGFQDTQRTVQVAVGEAAVVNVEMALVSGRETLEVTDAALAVQADNADLTTNIGRQQVASLPNPGNDVGFFALLAPGVTMSTSGGYGNFSSFGISATSNMFTLNGGETGDVFLNIANSGASNLLLGANDIAEIAVVNNGYSGQYGGLAGTQMNIVSKSGGNRFHGNAIYYWNGSAMNANNFFNNATDTSKPFSNSNMWAGSLGGPIRKDKTHFFFDYEALRLVFPTNSLVRVPSPQFASATLANLAATGQNQATPFYQKIFDLYAAAPGISGATPVTSNSLGCGTFKGLGAGVPCALQFRSNVANFTKEYVWTGRVDHNFNEHDSAFVQVQRDNGTQPTYTDPINPVFSAFSPQPGMNGQLSESHIFGSTAVNQFLLTGQFYSARFGPADQNAALQTFPTTIAFTSSLFNPIGGGGDGRSYPVGRNVTQYQIIDDFSKNLGRHTLKLGGSFHRVDFTNFAFMQFVTGRITESNLTDFYNGGGTANRMTQRFPSAGEAPFAYYNLGFYAQDEIKVSRGLKLNLTLRADRNSNPVCNVNCFANLVTQFQALDHNPEIPYNQAIQSGLRQAFPSTDALIWQPRFGFAWTPWANGKTVIRGGFGIFGDTFPGFITEALARNTPSLNSFSVTNGKVTPGAPNSLFATAANANQSLLNAYNSGGTVSSIKATNPFFTLPNYATLDGKYRQARYQEWNLEIQQALPGKLLLSANYVGNHGIHEVIQNPGLNAWATGFDGLPSTSPDSRFNIVTEYQTGGVSNYNGLVVSLHRRFAAGLSFQASYTLSHALDDVSNGGFAQYDLNTDISVLYPQDPNNIRKYNYGNSDYDVRHYFSANYVWDNALRHLFHGGPNVLFSGWTVAGTIFTRSGMPFTVVDSAASAALAGHGFQGSIFATVAGSGPTGCSASAVNTPCFQTSQFAPSTSSPTGFGQQARNQYRGPQYFNTDLSVMKNFAIPRWEDARLAFGLQFFNILNHPNFDKPVNDLAEGEGVFGTIESLVSAPTSLLGSFVGADATGRIIQVKATLTF